MKTEHQNKVWSILPKEFKEEEEMLTVPRSKVQEMYAHYDKICNDPNRPKDYIESVYEYADGVTMALDDLFGPKCLPDNVDSSEPNIDSLEPKPAEPKFKYNIGQKVKSAYANEILTIKEHCGRVGNDNVYKVEEYAYTWNECELRPYTEPEETSPNVNNSDIDIDELVAKGYVPDPAKQLDTILKDSFSKERRLNIATTIIGDIIKSGYYSLSEKYQEDNIDEMVKVSMQITDALIAESELTDKLKDR